MISAVGSMKINKVSLLMVLSSLITFNANSAATPSSQGYDARVQEINYNPKNVITISTAIGKSTLIQLEDGETILSKDLSGLGMGDSDAWGLGVRGNNIFIKPTAENPDTNLLLVSDKNRTYSFDLVSAKNHNKAAYVVKMLYPEPIVPKTKKKPCSDGNINLHYMKWGNDELSPQLVWDDGRFTCFKFGTNIEQPVIYKKSVTGKETLVNSHMEKDVLVAHSVAKEFRLRLGDSVLGIESKSVRPQGFNYKGTTLSNKKRVVIDHE